MKKVLVLNATHTPINITTWERAMTLLYKGKAAAVVYNGKMINGRYRLPEVIKLCRYVPLPFNEVVLTRRNIYLRDNHTCQYCGKTNGTLTIDHVIPRSRGGADRWENMVVCCARCNNRKADRLPDEAGMKLDSLPYRPPSTLYLHMTRLAGAPKSWYSYFFNEN